MKRNVSFFEKSMQSQKWVTGSLALWKIRAKQNEECLLENEHHASYLLRYGPRIRVLRASQYYFYLSLLASHRWKTNYIPQLWTWTNVILLYIRNVRILLLTSLSSFSSWTESPLLLWSLPWFIHHQRGDGPSLFVTYVPYNYFLMTPIAFFL